MKQEHNGVDYSVAQYPGRGKYLIAKFCGDERLSDNFMIGNVHCGISLNHQDIKEERLPDGSRVWTYHYSSERA